VEEGRKALRQQGGKLRAMDKSAARAQVAKEGLLAAESKALRAAARARAEAEGKQARHQHESAQWIADGKRRADEASALVNLLLHHPAGTVRLVSWRQ
jgi:hypothetical protein